MFGVRCNPGFGDGLPGPLATGLRLEPPFSVVPGAADGDAWVVGESCNCCSPILFGARLGTGGGGGGGIIISIKDKDIGNRRIH